MFFPTPAPAVFPYKRPASSVASSTPRRTSPTRPGSKLEIETRKHRNDEDLVALQRPAEKLAPALLEAINVNGLPLFLLVSSCFFSTVDSLLRGFQGQHHDRPCKLCRANYVHVRSSLDDDPCRLYFHHLRCRLVDPKREVMDILSFVSLSHIRTLLFRAKHYSL